MSRSREIVIAVVLGAVAIAGTAGAAAVFAPGTTSDQVFAGRFSHDMPVSVTNQTIVDGRYLVSYSMRVYVVSAVADLSLSCTVVDTSGQISNLPGLSRDVPAGRWVIVEAHDVFELPDVTLGIRCAPDTETVLEVLVRDVRLQTTRID